MECDFNKLAIIGVGLIGGSLGMACKERGFGGQIIGYGRSEERLRLAVRLGAIDSYQTDLTRGWEEIELVVLATPVAQIIPILERIAPCLKSGTIVTDVGSTKAGLVQSAEQILGPDKFFVGGHPIAGREKSGVGAASPTLFESAKCILTPTPTTNTCALQTVQKLWQELGSKVVLMDAQEHDYALAAVSHLPHIVAYSLVNTVLGLENSRQTLLSLYGGGFRDFTRIAASDPAMWRDICLANRDNLCEVISRFQEQLAKIKTLIQQGEGEKLLQKFQCAKKVKEG